MTSEKIVPILPCRSVDDVVPFHEALRFEVTYRQAHDPAGSLGNVLVVVPDTGALFDEFAAGLTRHPDAVWPDRLPVLLHLAELLARTGDAARAGEVAAELRTHDLDADSAAALAEIEASLAAVTRRAPMSPGTRGGPHSMLIIAGHLIVDPAEREAAMAVNTQVVALARKAPGCLDFAITADTLDPARIDVYERWESEEQLLAFRGSGLDGDDAARILDADVKRYTISAVGEP